jgi:hypothetical protein
MKELIIISSISQLAGDAEAVCSLSLMHGTANVI